MIGAFERFSLLVLVGAVALGIGAAAMLRMPAAPPAAPATDSASEQQQSENATTASALVANDVVEPSEYDLEAVANGAEVPRVFDWSPPENRDGAGHKISREESWRTILPLVLLVNEDILADRKQLWTIRQNLNLGERMLPEQRIWLEVVSEHYAAPAGDLDELARRIDVVPPSIVLAASERLRSGAQVVERGAKSAVPQRGAVIKQSVAKKRHHRDSPLDAVRAYVRALNTVPASHGFRKERERLRLAGEPLDGLHLAAFLPKLLPSYHLSSEELSAVIIAHRLTRFDRARLQPKGPAS